MRTKIILSVVVVLLAAALIAGATAAWFTDSDDVLDAEFTAGTVIVEAEGPTILPEAKVGNVNPGDIFEVTWTIRNAGTKASEFRVNLDKDWYIDEDHYWNVVTDERFARLMEEYGFENIEELEALLDTDNVSYSPVEGSDWVIYDDEGVLWLYYLGGPVAAGTSVPLELTVTFDGPTTDNKYMGAMFKLGGFVEAIQASNNAPATVWAPAWTNVKGGGPVQPDTYTVEATVTGTGTVTGEGTYNEGATVELEALAGEGYRFVKWVLSDGTEVTDNPYIFTITGNVTLEAVFEAEEPVEPTITNFSLGGSKSISVQTKKDWDHSELTMSATIVNAVGEDNQPFNGTRPVTIYHADFPTYFVTKDVTFTNGSGHIESGAIEIMKPHGPISTKHNKIRVEIDGNTRQY